MLEDHAPDNETSVDRMTLEALLFPPVDSRRESGTAGEEAAVQNVPTFDLIPEIVSCRFEYFSGSSWASTWNSDQQQGLPVAIRIRMRLVNAADLEKLTAVLRREQFAGLTA